MRSHDIRKSLCPKNSNDVAMLRISSEFSKKPSPSIPIDETCSAKVLDNVSSRRRGEAESGACLDVVSLVTFEEGPWVLPVHVLASRPELERNLGGDMS